MDWYDRHVHLCRCTCYLKVLRVVYNRRERVQYSVQLQPQHSLKLMVPQLNCQHQLSVLKGENRFQHIASHFSCSVSCLSTVHARIFIYIFFIFLFSRLLHHSIAHKNNLGTIGQLACCICIHQDAKVWVWMDVGAACRDMAEDRSAE